MAKRTNSDTTLAPLLTEATDDQAPDYTAPSLVGSLAPIMHPESLRRIEANYQAWLAERRAREASAAQ